MYLLQTAIDAAEAAGEVLLARWPETRAVTVKGLRDIVTDADLAAQQVIGALIAARFPQHAVLAEEGAHTADLHAPGPVWIVDPLDGTSNYARRYPGFCVSVAVAEGGQVVAAATHDPLRPATYAAERGQGAFVQRPGQPPERLHVSDTTELAQALVGLDWARDPATRARVLDTLGRVAPACRSVRAGGSTALGLAYVAAGWLDAYYNLSPQPWDVAAGWLLVTEAGGRVTTPAGGAYALGAGGLAATNDALHAAVVAALAQA